MFGKTDPASAAIIEEIRSLKREVAELRGEREGHADALALEKERTDLTRELTDLRIEYDREKEKWDREKREVEHMVGLQRKRADFEKEAAEREARLTVREENLTADKDRFEEHVSFMETRFNDELKALRTLMSKFLDRMPTTKQLITVGPNGNGEEDDDE